MNKKNNRKKKLCDEVNENINSGNEWVALIYIFPNNNFVVRVNLSNYTYKLYFFFASKLLYFAGIEI